MKKTSFAGGWAEPCNILILSNLCKYIQYISDEEKIIVRLVFSLIRQNQL